MDRKYFAVNWTTRYKAFFQETDLKRKMKCLSVKEKGLLLSKVRDFGQNIGNRYSFIVVRVSCEGSFLAYAWYNYYNTLKARPVQREIGPQTQFVWRSFVISGHKTIFQKPATALGYHLSLAVHPF